MANPLYFTLFSSVEVPVRNPVPEEFCKLSTIRTELFQNVAEEIPGHSLENHPLQSSLIKAPPHPDVGVSPVAVECSPLTDTSARFPQSPECSRFSQCSASPFESSCL